MNAYDGRIEILLLGACNDLRPMIISVDQAVCRKGGIHGMKQYCVAIFKLVITQRWV